MDWPCMKLTASPWWSFLSLIIRFWKTSTRWLKAKVKGSSLRIVASLTWNTIFINQPIRAQGSDSGPMGGR